jgi:hypothetical protein
MKSQIDAAILEMVKELRDRYDKNRRSFGQNNLRLMTRTYRREKAADNESAGPTTPL